MVAAAPQLSVLISLAHQCKVGALLSSMTCLGLVGLWCCCAGGRAVVPLAAGPFDQPSAAGELSSCPDSPQLPQSPAAPPSRRHSLVPKLLLPVPVTPAPNSASRLSLESSGRAVGIGTCRYVVKVITSLVHSVQHGSR